MDLKYSYFSICVLEINKKSVQNHQKGIKSGFPFGWDMRYLKGSRNRQDKEDLLGPD